MSLQRLIINSDLSAIGFKSVCDLSMLGLDAANNLSAYIAGLAGGNYMATITALVGAVQAVGTLTSAGTATAAQACTVLNVALTAVAANPGNNQFVPSATVATQAANIAAAINASTDLAGKVTATSLLGVTYITSIVPGLLGNGLQLSAGNLGNVTLGVFAGGLDGTSYVLDLD